MVLEWGGVNAVNPEGRHNRPQRRDVARQHSATRWIWWTVSIVLVAAGAAAVDIQGWHLPDNTPDWDVSRTGLMTTGAALFVLSISMVIASLWRRRQWLKRNKNNPLPGDRYRQAREKHSVGLRTTWMILIAIILSCLAGYCLLLGVSEQ